MQDIMIACDGVFGLEVWSMIREINKSEAGWGRAEPYHVKGFLYDGRMPFDMAKAPGCIAVPFDEWMPEEKVVMGVLKPVDKVKAVQKLRQKGARFETIIAPWMLAWPQNMTIGEGCVIAAYSAKDGIVIGDFVTVVASMLSGHGIGDYSTVMRFANIAGEQIGQRSYVGDHAFLPVGKSIGDDCSVMAGSIISRNVKNGATVLGVPARVVAGA